MGDARVTVVIARRQFGMEDQARFAALSGDTNPMHMDAMAARRTQAGEPVVHGVHALLWALDAAAGAGLPVEDAREIRVQFAGFIGLGREVGLQVVKRDGGGVRLGLVVEGVQAVTVLLRLGARRAAGVEERLEVVPAAGPAVLGVEEMAGCEGWLRGPVGDEGFAAAFPAAAGALGAARLSGLAQTSRLVGMVCPGLHSIYAGLNVELVDGGESAAGIGYRVGKADARFRLVEMGIWGSGLAGRVSAFVRQAPVEAPGMAEIARVVVPGEFAGVTALVAGGSRGLGAVTAKIIAAGGGQVAITYATGLREAEAVRGDIASVCGARACRVLAYDAMRPATEQLGGVAGWAGQLYFFATTPIFGARAEGFVAARFATFSRVYVVAFHECCVAMAREDLAVFYPSSVAVEERPAGMLEYGMAKMAGEMLCAEMGGRVLVSRLPRVLTDQTATVARAESADAVETMLPLVRAMRGDS